MSGGLQEAETHRVLVDTNDIDRASSPVPSVSRVDHPANVEERNNARNLEQRTARERLLADARELLRKKAEAEARTETLQQQLSKAKRTNMLIIGIMFVMLVYVFHTSSTETASIVAEPGELGSLQHENNLLKSQVKELKLQLQTKKISLERCIPIEKHHEEARQTFATKMNRIFQGNVVVNKLATKLAEWVGIFPTD